MSEPEPEERRTPSPEDPASTPAPDDTPAVLGRAMSAAARRAGIDPDGEDQTGAVVWKAMGGLRGVFEATLPSLAFLLLFTFAENLPLALAVSVGLAAIFTVIRLVQGSPASAAFGGLIATGAAAVLALVTGRGEDNFVLSFVTNAVYGTAFLVSALVGWSLVGLVAGYLMNEGTTWRSDRRKRRIFFWLTIMWAALFYLRLAVQLPFYFAGDVTALGTAKLLMGLPLFAPALALTWIAVRALYARGAAATAPPQG